MAAVPPPDGNSASAAGRLSLLLVEGDHRLASALVKTLELAGHRVRWAGRRHLPPTPIITGPPDVIIADLDLPDGIEVSRLAACPVVVYTSRTDQSADALAREAGAASILVKPFGTTDLLAAIADVVG